MASNTGEPSSKRSRLEEKEINQSMRYIKLDMAKYDSSVQKYSDDDLVKIFELGLKVKESASLNVAVDQKMMEDALSSKMKPIHESVTRIEQQVNEQVKKVQENVATEVNNNMITFAREVEDLKKNVTDHMTEIKDQLTTRVDTVAQKVQPLDILNSTITTSASDIKTEVHKDIDGSEKRVSDQLKECQKKLETISSSLEKPSNKGARAERKVIDVLKQNLTNFTFLAIPSEMGKGDIEAQSPNNHKIMIEVKQWKRNVDRDDIEKFEKDLANSPHFKVGILLSMTSGIARRSREGRFEICFDQSQKQYQIYVPNAYANNEEHLIVWSVVMADQLAQIDGELGEMKTKGLTKIYKKFADRVQHSKDCKLNLEALENSVTNLRNSIQPILQTIDEAKEDINKLLHPS